MSQDLKTVMKDIKLKLETVTGDVESYKQKKEDLINLKTDYAAFKLQHNTNIELLTRRLDDMNKKIEELSKKIIDHDSQLKFE